MFDRIINERGYSQLQNEETVTPVDQNSQEFIELQFHFNTIFNDMNKKQNSSETSMYEIEKAYSLKNQYISLNFAKREMNEVSSYGWCTSEVNDDKKIDELVNRLKNKGLERIEQEIKVSALSSNNQDIHNIILCKFIVGECEISFSEEPLNEAAKEAYKPDFDTIVRMTKDGSRHYIILKEENIELLYLIKIKEVEFQSQLITCSSLSCIGQDNQDSSSNKENEKNKIMYYCLLKDNYFCIPCHNEIHRKEVFFGLFDVNKCERKEKLNLPGECGNKELHPNKQNFDIDYFCCDCLKGICSYCRVYGNEKHKELTIIGDLFSKSKLKDNSENKEYKKITDNINNQTKKLKSFIKTTTDRLKDDVKNKFQQLFHELNEKFTEEGEKLVSICYQLNFLKDNLNNYHEKYNQKESLLLLNKIKQELFWTKRVHMDHLLYLIAIKDNIETSYKVDENKFEIIINNYMKGIDEIINQMIGNVESVEVKKEEDDGKINVQTLIEQANIKEEN